jgi:hypothetical protein
MAERTDNFTDESKLNETLGSEVLSGELISEDLQSGNVLSFDGTNDVVAINGLVADVSSDTVGTVAAWVKYPAAITNITLSITTAASPGEGVSCMQFLADGTLRAVCYDAGVIQWDVRSTGDERRDDEWMHVALVQDGTEPVLYANGVAVAQSFTNIVDKTKWLSDLAGLDTANIGAIDWFGGGDSNFITGSIADVRYYSTDLSAQQIASLAKGNPLTTTNLEGHWKLDEGTGTSATDQSANANTGTISGASWIDGKIYTLESRTTSDDKLGDTTTYTSVDNFKYTTTAKPGGTASRVGFSNDYDVQRENVLSFDGINDYVSIADDASLDIGTSDFSISAWIKTSSETSQGIYYKHTGSPATTGYDVRITSTGGIILDFHDGINRYYTSTNVVVWDGEWHHIVGVVDRNSAANTKIYMDGASLTATPVGTIGNVGTITNTQSAYLGSSFSDTTKRYFDGSIADARVYDDVLTSDEVNYIYTSGKEGTDPTTANLVSQWLLDEGTGTSAADNAGSNTGTITSATWATNTDIAHLTSTWKNSNGDNLVRGGYSFDGVNDDIQDGSVPLDPSSAFTWSAWVKPNVVGSTTIFGEGRSSASYPYINIYFSTIFAFVVRNDADTNVSAYSTHSAIAGKWTHLAITNSGSFGFKFYIEGVEVPETANTLAGAFTNLDKMSIGSLDRDSTSAYYDGDISDMQIYDAELTPSEIWNIYANSKPRATNQVSRWKLNSNALDEWGSNDGTVSGAIPLPARANTPIVGDSLNQRSIASFDGVNDEISFGADSSLAISGDLSIEGWIYLRETLAGNSYLFGKMGGDNTDRGYSFRVLTAGQAAFISYAEIAAGTTVSFAGTSTLLPNLWYHIAATRSDGEQNIYVNGVLENSDTKSGPWDTSSQNGMIGAGFSTGPTWVPTQFTEGSVANVAVYNDIRTASEILVSYQDGYVDTSNANLVSYWPLDGDYLDWKGSNHGTNNGSTIVKAIDGPIGKRNFGHDNVLTFDGVNDDIDIGTTSTFDFTSSAFSVSFWVKFNDVSTYQSLVMRGQWYLEGWEIALATTAEIWLRTYQNSGIQTSQSTANSIPKDEWINVTCARSGTTCNIYINGVLDVDVAASHTDPTTSTDALVFGVESSGGASQYFDGDMSDVRIYDAALTADEVQYIYTNGDQGTDPTTTNLVSQWLLDEGTGTTATDNAGSNDGTITGATWDKGLVPPMNLDGQVTINLGDLSFTDSIFVKGYFISNSPLKPFALTEWSLDYVTSVTFIPKVIYY